MIMGGNQPYFMPYIGYWQLINAVDTFILGDDFNYIKGGWINRNRILQSGNVSYFNIEISHASSNKKINELTLAESFDPYKKLQQLTIAYQKAPYFSDGYALMKKILTYENHNLSDFLAFSIQCVCDYLDISTKIIFSSSIPHDSNNKREYRIYEHAAYCGANKVINAIGGKELYSYQQFHEQGLSLGFIKAGDIHYVQFSSDFTPNLSILDVIMFNSKDEIKKMLDNYTILWEEGPSAYA